MTPDELERATLAALWQTHVLHDHMGEAGAQPMQSNQFGETALALDIAAEAAVIDTFAATGHPIQFITEEHGVVTLGDSPQLLGIIDGLDGSGVYRTARGTGRYGTMVAIFDGLNPCYDDYLICGIMLHAPQPHLLYACRNKGCVVIDDTRRHLHCAATTTLADVQAIAYDDYFELNREVFGKPLADVPIHCDHSSAAHFADLVSEAVDAVLECTRKQNLEFAVAYGMIVEAGGVMITLDGESLGKQFYRSFAPTMHIPIIAACTRELGTDLLQHISNEGYSS